ncbi:MAG: extracellular solute-binding protein [Oscillospiraceae bacterium]|jgi:ABC-type glycerol-3-phosphate transport system substrate-binding protein|nr:extracellular solute-binding protein [Oscillospiraceae bacterium]
MRHFRALKRAAALFVSGTVFVTCVCPAFTVFAQGGGGGEAVVGDVNEGIMGGSTRSDLYQYYYEKHKGEPRPSEEIYIEAVDYDELLPDSDFGEYPQVARRNHMSVNDCLLWENDLGRVNYVFDVKTSGIYNMEFYYHPISGGSISIDVGLLIDGEYPFSAAKNIELDRLWKNDGSISKDKNDNEILPLQVEFDTWMVYPVKDKEGLFNEPYFFYFEKGRHTLTVEGIKVKTVFKSITFKNYPELTPYSEVKPTEEQINSTPELNPIVPNEIGSSTILLEGQTPLYKSSSELVPTYDRATYLVSPSHPVKMRYNTMGSNGTWAKAGQSATWEFTVQNDGYYRFSARVKQNMMRGFYSNRRVLIDGEVPVAEFNCQQFKYSPRWYRQNLVDENGDDIYIFLKSGTHRITLEAVPGEIGETMQRLEEIVYTLNYYYRRILMITGPNPDEFNPYYVDKQIPELLPTFEDIIAQLYAEKARVERYSSTGSEASTLETMAVILKRCVNKPDQIPMMRRTLKDNISALSAWMREKSFQPLEIDYVEIATVHEKFGRERANFFEELVFGWRAFIGSFFNDYTKLDDGKGINVWVGLGRDQALLVKELVDNDFNLKHEDTPVTINLVQGSILEATLAGKGPEVATFIGGDFPVQLAARNLTVDLTTFRDYEEIAEKRFTEQLPIFFTYRGGVYGLPISQVFPVMFYRTDILDELGVEPPKTWDDFVKTIAILNRAYLEIGLLPPTSNLSSTIFEPGETFTMLQLQTGQNFYTEDLTRTMFDTEESIAAFTMWTKFYTVYQFEQTYDPFTRFRTGEMPIVIQPYTFYNQIYAAAPELKGLWDFTHVPGTVRKDADGNEFLDIAASSSSMGAVIFNKTKDKAIAWEFLKWYTSDETQTRFGRSMEALVGPIGRFDTANVNALPNLSWSAVELRKLVEQRDALVEIPMIPANYASTRHIKNAFRAVVNDNWLPRYAISSYNRDINAEITRKNAEIASWIND